MLTAGQSVTAADGQYTLVQQYDGNLVLYMQGRPLWASHTSGSALRTVMQSDGNLVIYDSANRPRWNSQTAGKPGAFLAVQPDGNLVIYTPSGQAVWASYTVSDLLTAGQSLAKGQYLRSGSGATTFTQQSDGNLVLYTAGRRAIWASNTAGATNAKAAMQGDGNFVIYATDGRPIWASNTAGNAGARLAVQRDGNVVIYSSSGRALWASHTSLGALKPGQSLGPGEYVESADGRYTFVQQGDGNLVLYAGSKALWANHVSGSGMRTHMQTDGNLVTYAPGGRAVWASQTCCRSGAVLVVQNDGNVVIYAGPAVWATHTAGGTVSQPAVTLVDDYPAKWRNIAQDSVFDDWGYYNRECVSFVAWRMASRNGAPVSYAGNANQWDDWARAPSRNYPINGTPAVGSIAHTDAGGGHVAWVAAVGAGTVTIEEYNQNWDGTYRNPPRTVPSSAFQYIHVKDL